MGRPARGPPRRGAREGPRAPPSRRARTHRLRLAQFAQLVRSGGMERDADAIDLRTPGRERHSEHRLQGAARFAETGQIDLPHGSADLPRLSSLARFEDHVDRQAGQRERAAALDHAQRDERVLPFLGVERLPLGPREHLDPVRLPRPGEEHPRVRGPATGGDREERDPDRHAPGAPIHPRDHRSDLRRGGS
ncbi:MAG: hypothetical protein D6718_13435 [Acidobacteria bacterium]|nr:MAG: hypothetical protein D6718_13435 [Acidobacteriota bacterium]